jgi:hypothetical protein
MDPRVLRYPTPSVGTSPRATEMPGARWGKPARQPPPPDPPHRTSKAVGSLAADRAAQPHDDQANEGRTDHHPAGRGRPASQPAYGLIIRDPASHSTGTCCGRSDPGVDGDPEGDSSQRYIGLLTRVVSFVGDAALINLVAIIVGIGASLIFALLHLPRRVRADPLHPQAPRVSGLAREHADRRGAAAVHRRGAAGDKTGGHEASRPRPSTPSPR